MTNLLSSLVGSWPKRPTVNSPNRDCHMMQFVEVYNDVYVRIFLLYFCSLTLKCAILETLMRKSNACTFASLHSLII